MDSRIGRRKMTKWQNYIKKVQFLLNWISTSDRVFLPDCSLFLALSWMVGGYHVSDARKVWKRSPSPARWNFCFRFLIKPRKIWSFDHSLPSAPPSKVSYFNFHSSQGRWCVMVIAVIITTYNHQATHKSSSSSPPLQNSYGIVIITIIETLVCHHMYDQKQSHASCSVHFPTAVRQYAQIFITSLTCITLVIFCN